LRQSGAGILFSTNDLEPAPGRNERARTVFAEGIRRKGAGRAGIPGRRLALAGVHPSGYTDCGRLYEAAPTADTFF